jgi:hypothetical protein
MPSTHRTNAGSPRHRVTGYAPTLQFRSCPAEDWQ